MAISTLPSQAVVGFKSGGPTHLAMIEPPSLARREYCHVLTRHELVIRAARLTEGENGGGDRNRTDG